MCNLYKVDTNLRRIARDLQARIVFEFDCREIIAPRGISPGITLAGQDGRLLQPMQFGLAPIGCKTPTHEKYALNNARVEEIHKWPWDLPFKRSRCVVPLLAFREPCYWGGPEGQEAYFHAADMQPLFVASIYNLWQSPDGGQQIVTMSFLMRPACRYVMENGHHRQPFLLEPDGIDEWMSGGERSVKDSMEILRTHVAEPELMHTVDRQMADSWQRRKKMRLKKRDTQLEEIERTRRPIGI